MNDVFGAILNDVVGRCDRDIQMHSQGMVARVGGDGGVIYNDGSRKYDIRYFSYWLGSIYVYGNGYIDIVSNFDLGGCDLGDVQIISGSAIREPLRPQVTNYFRVLISDPDYFNKLVVVVSAMCDKCKGEAGYIYEDFN